VVKNIKSLEQITMNNNVQTIFISGANRGIGKELALQLSRQNHNVIAGYRDESRSQSLLAEAQKSATLFPFKVDVTSETDLKSLYTFIASKFKQLDVLINNAGVFQSRNVPLNELAWSAVAHHIDVNVGSVFLATACLYPLLKEGEGKKIINISSQLASIAMNHGGSFPYNVSKTAMNMLTKHQAIEYQADAITAIRLSPGWVQTDMGGDAAPLTVQQSATKIIHVMETITLADSGHFLSIDGEVLPY
jgi:NAD(P)-dependent dehydrogenase (short-subunit alcohol dehydrogenase family)